MGCVQKSTNFTATAAHSLLCRQTEEEERRRERLLSILRLCVLGTSRVGLTQNAAFYSVDFQLLL